MEDGFMKANRTGNTAPDNDTLRRRILGLRDKFRPNPNQIGFTSGESQTEDSDFSSSDIEEPITDLELVQPNSHPMEDPQDKPVPVLIPGEPKSGDDSSSSDEDDVEITSELEDPPGTEGIYNVNPHESSESSSDSEDDGSKLPDEEDDPDDSPPASLSGDSIATLEDNKDFEDRPDLFPAPPKMMDVDDQTNESQPSSSSSSDSELEESPHPAKDDERGFDDNELTPLSLRKALDEREKDKHKNMDEPGDLDGLGARKPSEPALDLTTPDIMDRYSPEAFDFTGDPSIRARTAFDFDEGAPTVPPTLPPKIKGRDPSDIEVNRKPPGSYVPEKKSKKNRNHNSPPDIFRVNDRTSSLGRGMWSDDEEEPRPRRKTNSIPKRHPQPDRIIDFSRNPQGDHSLKRSRSERRKSPSGRRPKNWRQAKSRSPDRLGHRVLDFSSNPYIDPNNGINTQAMISLHANAGDSDVYDSVQDSGEELNHLIDQANSLGYHRNFLQPSEDIYQRTKPKEKKLDSKHTEAFAKIVAPFPYKASPMQSAYRNDNPASDASRKSNRSQPRRNRRVPHPSDAIEGDDETSVTESDMERLVSPRQPHSSMPFVTQIYPYSTEFDTYSETEPQDTKPLDRTSSFVSDDTLQDTYNPNLGPPGKYVYGFRPGDNMDTDMDEDTRAQLNPIVSSNFQICADVSGSKSFPARIRVGKPKTKRPPISNVAIPLNQASKNRQVYPTSLPYFGDEFGSDYGDLVRSGSVDEVYPIHKPSIVVHRQPTYPNGYNPDLEPMVLQSSPPKKEKKKKEKKETTEKIPQINLKVDGEPNGINNNLQINLLPSDDPNVINLNIRSSSVNPSGPSSLPAVLPINTEIKEPFPAVVDADNQHRVVDVNTPPVVLTGNDNLLAASYSDNGGILLAGGVPTEIIPSTVSASPLQTVSLGLYPQLAASHSMPAAARVSQPAAPLINTRVSMPPVQQAPVQFNHEPTVVTVEAPWPLETENRERSLSSGAKHPERMNRGDSGIDLTMHDGNRRSRRGGKEKRRRRSESRGSSRRASSVASSNFGSKRRSSSKRNLKSNDYLGEATATLEYMAWYRNKHLRPSCCYIVMKHFMFVLNLIFTLAGLALLGLGVWGMVELHRAGITDATVIVTDPLFTIMIIGLVTALVAFQGAAGFIRDNMCMLKCFGASLVILFIIFVVGGITFWAMMARVETFAVDTISQLIRQYDPNTRVGLSYSLNLMQDAFECCGMSGSQDWTKNEIFKCSSKLGCPLPKSCCPTTADKNLKCVTTKTQLTYQMGCNATMANAIRDNTPIIVGSWFGIWALMIIELIFIYIMCKEVRYLQKIRSFIKNPTKYMEKKHKKASATEESEESETSEESSEEDSETSSSSEEEYRKKRKHRKQDDRNKRERGRKEKRNQKNKKRRERSYHINRAYSIQDERKSGRRSQRDTRSRKRSHSRRRDSY